MDKNVKNCLEERVKHNTKYPNCKAYRAVFYTWDETDRIASEFCAGLKMMKNGNAHPVSVTKPEEVTTVLHKAWEKCREEAADCGLTYSKGLYALIIGSSPEIAQNVNLDGSVEFVRVVENSDLHNLSGEELSDCQTEWRIRKSDVSAAAVLLMHAAYSDGLLIPQSCSLKDHYVYGLKCKEYHAVREEVCRYYHAILAQRLEESIYDLEKVEKCLYIKQRVEEVCNCCVKAEWLPYIGYEKLEKKLGEKYKKSLSQKMASIFSEKYRRTVTDWTVRQVLEVLQGEVSGKSNVEILRKEMKIEKLPTLCKRVIEQNEDLCKELLVRNFSLYDLNYTLSGKLEEYSRQIFKRASVIEDRLIESLEKRFAGTNWNLCGILEGLDQYYSLWNEYIKIYAEGIYLRKLAEFVEQLWNKDKTDYEELTVARTVLRESMSCVFFTSARAGEEMNFEKLICNQGDLLETLKNYVSHAEFREGDVAKMIDEADRHYQSTKEMHVDSSRHPQIQLLFNKELDEREERKNCHFKWILHAVDYIPKSVLWELRVYTYRNEKVGVKSET